MIGNLFYSVFFQFVRNLFVLYYICSVKTNELKGK